MFFIESYNDKARSFSVNVNPDRKILGIVGTLFLMLLRKYLTWFSNSLVSPGSRSTFHEKSRGSDSQYSSTKPAPPFSIAVLTALLISSLDNSGNLVANFLVIIEMRGAVLISKYSLVSGS